MSDQGLSAPGSSAYSSDSLYVGDGTWDSQRNTFLLPNLMGINFDTMRYNGMGNRFRNMVGYKPLILAHGILAAITFLFVVPGAIFMARFYHRNPRLALRVHIWLQVMTLLLATALIVLGFQAVGPERSLTNPHHGIGVALYALVVLQVLGGSIIHRLEKGKERFKVPLKLILHQWVGRVVLLLGIAQIPLGLTLWGSPLVLFILFAVWAFLLLIVYFVLSYRNQPEMGFDDNTTYITDRSASTRSRRSRGGGRGIGALATAGAAGAGLAALASRNSYSRSRSRRRGDETTVLSSRPDSRSRVTDSRFNESYMSDEKYNDTRKGSTWKDRLMGAGAAAGGIFAIKSLFGKKKDRRAYTETSTGSDISYGRPLGQSEVTQTDISRLEEGMAPDSPKRNQDWRRVEEREAAQAAAMGASPVRPGHRSTRSGGSIDSFDSRTSFNTHHDSRPLREESGYGVKDGIMTLGVLGFIKHTFNKRKNAKEDARIEEMRQHDMEEEKMARANSNRRRFTGDGAAPRRHGPPSTIYSETEISGMTPSVARPNAPPVMTSSAGPSVLRPTDNTVLSDSGSEAYVSPGGRSHRRHRNSAGAAALAGGAAAGAPSGSPSRRRNSRDESIVSPPVSVKVKMHNDGRHVTLRRLNEEEAAAERDARRRERQRRTRTGSMSSLSQLDGDRWRRTEALEAQQAQEMAQAGLSPASPAGAPLQMPEPYVPPPPPGPPSNFASPVQRPSPQTGFLPPPPDPAGDPSILSSPQGTQVYGTETDVSNYDTNRRRRRAERAQAKQARSGGSRVEFS
ncbi:hypothetical protein C7974DRAFT_363807 [Boeremia exigua]|uniref:uncharacterized protein n=1 Tax=Boeremia exigua TaxID=749465 RepID=UPI001E8DFDDF|nr:uncharacterized protein C7974DRAFT_363807 [Boeremia exigua]KAH6620337.1 hypothetical protein C7974DRAFT_363807 [Boeremia exigua]